MATARELADMRLNQERKVRYVNRFRARQKARGYCLACALPAEPGKQKCATHLDRSVAENEAYKERLANDEWILRHGRAR